jgi:hypothetical protein
MLNLGNMNLIQKNNGEYVCENDYDLFGHWKTIRYRKIDQVKVVLKLKKLLISKVIIYFN